MSPSVQIADPLTASMAESLKRAAEHLLSRQRPEGFWWGDLTADSTLESDWFLLLLWMHPPKDGVWTPPDREKARRAANSILARQNGDGGFPIYPQGPSDVSASVKAYFALKLAGVHPDSESMLRLRERILAMGGVQASNSYTKINLSLFNLYPRTGVPAIPPEIVLVPRNVLYEMSSWTRAIVVTLSLVQTLNEGGRPVPRGFTLEEIFAPGVPTNLRVVSESAWSAFFVHIDRFLKRWSRLGPKRIRRRAVEAARRWMVERLEKSDGLAAIYPPMMYSIMALDLLGYSADTPERAKAQAEFDRLLVDDGHRFFFMPCFSPVWDTAIAAHALGAANAAPRQAMARCGSWLVSKEVRTKGDWSIKRPQTEPSGWYFEFANEFYPDIDDSAMVLLALAEAKRTMEGEPLRRLEESAARGLEWLEAMQSADGGWAAFDVDNDWELLSHVPFADHNAMLDPTCPDITGRVLEALCTWGRGGESPAVRRGLDYLLKNQEADGSWRGRWGVNYVYGTFLALRGLKAAGYDDHEASVLRAGEWLRSVQNADGGWGESCESYDRSTFVPAESTPSQTAWAVLGLIAGGDAHSESVRRGAEFLASTQREDGGWDERLATGTGFPKVFYLCYHLYRDSFPVLALAEYLRARQTPARHSVQLSRGDHA